MRLDGYQIRPAAVSRQVDEAQFIQKNAPIHLFEHLIEHCQARLEVTDNFIPANRSQSAPDSEAGGAACTIVAAIDVFVDKSH
jgi:hypothetical protein